MCHIALLFVVSVGVLTACDASRVRASAVRLGPNPAIIVRLHKSALDLFFNSVSTLGGKYAGHCPIPDVKATVGGVDIQTRNFHLTRFEKPIIKYEFYPPNKINGSVEFPLVGVEGPFSAARRTLLTTQRDNGSIVFNATKIQVFFQVTLGECASGMPKVETIGCQSFLGPSSLNVKGCKANYAIEVLKVAASQARSVYGATVCPTVNRLIGNQLNRLLEKIPNVLEINKKFAYKYQVKPQVGRDYVQVGLFGKCITSEVSPYTPAKFVESPSNDAIVVLLISDAIFNDFAYQLYAHNKLAVTLDRSWPPLIYSLLALKCDPNVSACLGNVAPNLAVKYGDDADVEAVLKANEAPIVEFVQDKAIFRGSLNAILSISPANDTKTYLEATAGVEVSGDLKIKIYNNSIYAKIDITNVTVKIDEEHNKKWEDKIRNTIELVVEEVINSGILLKGIPLRLPFGMGVSDALIKFAAHTLQAHCGFDFTAQTSSEERQSNGGKGGKGGKGGNGGKGGGRSDDSRDNW